MSSLLLWLLLPVAALSGWYLAKRDSHKSAVQSEQQLSSHYIKGLNYLLNEQPDKAIDIFVKMMETDGDAVEIHLAVGSLFRKRGEVERATRIHQNLISNVSLDAPMRSHALLELARDYLSAGLLDRTEDLCLEIVDTDQSNLPALKLLCDIYEQEKEWFRAVDVARKIQTNTGESNQVIIAQYYCELAQEARGEDDLAQAKRMLDKALIEHPMCGRAFILQGDIEAELGHHRAAIAMYRRLDTEAIQYLPEVFDSLLHCYDALNRRSELLTYLMHLLTQYRGVELVLFIARLLREGKGVDAALNFLSDELGQRPSLRSIRYLFELEGEQKRVKLRKNSSLVKQSLDKLLENKPTYRCNNCGFTGVKMHWHCPRCKQWATIQPIEKFQWGASI